MPVYISPHFTNEKLEIPTLEDLVDVFEDRIRYWLLEPTKTLLRNATGQIAGFCVLLTYFEGIWTYVQGKDSKNQSKRLFQEAFVEVFCSSRISEDLLRRIAQVLYEDARCGFFHDGMFRERIYFKKLEEGDFLVTLPKKNGRIDETGEIQSILVDPGRFYAAIERHFTGFVATLRDPKEAAQRTKFERICREKWDWEGEGPVIGISDPTDKAT